MAYDFKNISPQDFQELCRDLLEKDLRVKLQLFKPGKDGGIDLLHSAKGRNEIVIQCKHFARSSFSQLIVSLKQEVAKIKGLKPKRYVIATSLPLSKQNKDRIKSLFGKYIRDVADIYGLEQLNALLQKYPKIEKVHFKLWIASTAVLERVLNNGIFRGSEITLEKIAQRVPLYVQNESFDKARGILESEHVCVIAGDPGIGKTTLANMLSLKYMSNGYEFIQIQSDISEAKAVDSKRNKRIYYYDDFLGQTNLDQKLGKNEDQALLDFIDHVRRSKTKRFILTTRQYILNQVRLRYEKIEREFDVSQCVVDLKSYSEFEKARILYNHIYFSSLPPRHRQALLHGKAYLKIIEHDNYNPRLLEYMTMKLDVNENDDSTYVASFLDTLDHPKRIWSEAFERHLSMHAKTLALLLLMFAYEATLRDLQSAYASADSMWGDVNGGHLIETKFNDALKELEGNFIQIKRSHGDHFISYQNPSVRDYLEEYALENRLPERLIGIASNFGQLRTLWNFASKRSNDSFVRAYISASFAAIQRQPEFGIEHRILYLLGVIEKTSNESSYSFEIGEVMRWYLDQRYTNISALTILLVSLRRESWVGLFSEEMRRKFRERLIEDLSGFDEIKEVAENWEDLNDWILEETDLLVIQKCFVDYATYGLQHDLKELKTVEEVLDLQNDFGSVCRIVDEYPSEVLFKSQLAVIKEEAEEEERNASEDEEYRWEMAGGRSVTTSRIAKALKVAPIQLNEGERIDALFATLSNP